jgi:hypothetical protein
VIPARATDAINAAVLSDGIKVICNLLK